MVIGRGQRLLSTKKEFFGSGFPSWIHKAGQKVGSSGGKWLPSEQTWDLLKGPAWVRIRKQDGPFSLGRVGQGCLPRRLQLPPAFSRPVCVDGKTYGKTSPPLSKAREPLTRIPDFPDGLNMAFPPSRFSNRPKNSSSQRG